MRADGQQLFMLTEPFEQRKLVIFLPNQFAGYGGEQMVSKIR
ncbi:MULTISPECIES: hypothetical protein [Laceyella]|uniref:Uncharacterized protein n=1 Tax=Laceyella sacchari TaxID=37482 RepID=A0ABY5U5G2_LACSH|nr:MULTISPECIES: hypothetical protein [Laceyella]UWE04873.1 hypothetical protein NYR52_07065 [Laceyella sacchari]